MFATNGKKVDCLLLGMLLIKKAFPDKGKAFLCGADGARTRDLLRDRQAL